MYIKLASSTWISGQPTKGQQRANPENNRKCNEKNLILPDVKLF